MRVSRATYGLALIGFSLVMTGCGSISRGLGSVTSEGLVDEYAIPQNRSLAYPTDFSRLPVPQNPQDVTASLPSQAEIESLMFTLEPEPEPEYVPLTVVTGEIPEYQPIGRIVASGSNGAASQAFVSAQTNAAGSIYPVIEATPAADPSLITAPVPAAEPAALYSVSSEPAPIPASGFSPEAGVIVLSPEDAAALAALAVTAPIAIGTPASMSTSASVTNGAQVVTSLPDGVTMIGEPVVIQR